MVRGASVFAAVAIWLWAAPVAAQTSIHGTGRVGISYNDNILGARTNPGPDEAQVVDDFSLEIAPGLMLVHRTPRLRLRLAYSRPLILFLQHPGAAASQDEGLATLSYAASPVDDLDFVLVVNRLNTNMFGALQSSTPQTLGDQSVLVTSLGEQFDHRFSERWALAQTLTLGASTPLADDSTLASALRAEASIGPQLRHDQHTWSLTAAASYNKVLLREEPVAVADDEPVSDSVVPQIMAGWRWDFAPGWASEIAAGAAFPFGSDGFIAAAPVGGAHLSYQHGDGWGASLHYGRAFSASAITGQTFYSDQGRLEGAIPVWPAADLAATANVSIAHNRLVTNVDSEQDVSATAFSVAVTLGWYPDDYPVAVAAHYQHMRQFNAPEDQTLLPNMKRNVVSLVLSYVIPELLTDEGRSALAPTHGGGRGDEDDDGEE